MAAQVLLGGIQLAACEARLRVEDDFFADAPGARAPIDVPLSVILGKPPRMHRDVKRVRRLAPTFDFDDLT